MNLRQLQYFGRGRKPCETDRTSQPIPPKMLFLVSFLEALTLSSPILSLGGWLVVNGLRDVRPMSREEQRRQLRAAFLNNA